MKLVSPPASQTLANPTTALTPIASASLAHEGQLGRFPCATDDFHILVGVDDEERRLR